MLINSVTLENFRLFHNKHEIKFSADAAKPVTIIIAENGAGKTTLLNAVHWAFTGEFTKQFQNSGSVINKYAFDEGKKTCSVEVEFSNEKKRYLLRRTLTHGSRDTDLTLHEYDSAGALDPIKSELVKIVIEQFIPKRLASWFFFDGEAIGHLHLNGDPKFRDEIRQTFGFSGLERLIKTLTEIDKDYRREENRLLENDELTKIENQLEKLEQGQEDRQRQIVNLTQTISDADNKKSELSSRLSGYAQAEPLQAKRERAERMLKEAKIKRDQKQRLRNDYFTNVAPKTLLKDEINSLVNELNQKEEDQSLPEPFGTKLIEQIKYLQKCICGTRVSPGSKEEQCLDQMMEKAASGQLIQKIFSFRSEIGSYQKEAAEFSIRMDVLTSEIIDCENNIATQEQIINQANLDLSNIRNEEVIGIRKELAQAENKIRDAEGERGYARSNFDAARLNIANLKARQDVILSQLKRTSHISKEREKVAKLINFVSDEFKRQEQEVLNALNSEISGVLLAYLTKNFTAQVDANTYAVKVFDIDGRLVPLSTGESNLLKFAVIAAIVGMAANRTKLTSVNWISEPIIAPLMFDAPFSLVDSEYRSGITQNLSELASQLIMMFDGDKWNDELATILRLKIGKMYVLVSKAAGLKKSIKKTVEIDGEVLSLNEYGERDETVIKEVHYE
jgi:DNA sulfur modification protein DndD